MGYFHQAIHQLYASVHTCLGDEPNVKAYDKDGKEVVFDASAVTTKKAEIETADKLFLLRFQRNEKLAETDYWDASDTPAMTSEQATYRQALRDITKTATSLDDVKWPTKPE